MKSFFWILSFFLVLLVSFPNQSLSAQTLDPEIAKFYNAADFEGAARIIEQQIGGLKEKRLKNEPINIGDFFTRYFLLANLYAWRLEKADLAILKYTEFHELRKSSSRTKPVPSMEFLYTAEIYEKQKALSRAEEYYRMFLKELVAMQEMGKEEGTDPISMTLDEDYINLAKYQIDSLFFQKPSAGEYKPLLKKVKKPSPFTLQLVPSFAILLTPTMEYDALLTKGMDLADAIRQSPMNFASSFQNYVRIVSLAAGSVTESSERALEAYLKKYPESYHSLPLRYLFYKYYRDNGPKEKGEQLARELKEIGKKRRMEIMIEPDQRFSSPEKTWALFNRALAAGDLETASECVLPGQLRTRALREMGPEERKGLAKKISYIEKETASKEEAQYTVKEHKEDEEGIASFKFYRIDGEWKIERFPDWG